MHAETIRDIAEAIVRDQLLLNWQFYALICTISIVAAATGNLLVSYFKKRGETLATKADMKEILRQLHDTTRVTEEVRSSVSHADWVAREWRTTRRLKLEELLLAAYSIDKWLDLQKDKWVHGETVDSDIRPLEQLNVIATLYFPELKAETMAVWMTHHDTYRLILDVASRVNAAKEAKDLNAHQAELNRFTEQYKPLYQAARLAISALEAKASKLMGEVAGA